MTPHLEADTPRLAGNCDLDVDECDSSPCQNGATCTESSVESSVSFHAYQCTCVAGFANGVCEYDGDARDRSDPPYGFIVEYASECDVQESNGADGTASSHLIWRPDTPRLAGNCDIDVDECDSSPCQNGATCTESSVESSVSFHAYQCTCVAGFANGVCEYSFIEEFADLCDVQESSASGTDPSRSGNCDIDVNECASSPCQNGAACSDSTVDTSISIDAYQCTCVAGFANGVCDYDNIALYDTECDVQESSVSVALSGNCDIDVNECDSDPCQNNAACSESTSNDDVSYHTYRCSCVEGFANGACDYDFIEEFTAQCSIAESGSSACEDDASWTDSTGAGCDGYGDDLSQGQVPCAVAASLAAADGRTAADACCVCQTSEELVGNCDLDVDECSSGPCQNGAACAHSETGLSHHAYSCACTVGYANGNCSYSYIDEYETQCSVMESMANLNDATLSGNCDVDVNECDSNPCRNGASCSESTSDTSVSVAAYKCTCVAGFADGVCEYDFIDVYQEECVVVESSNASAQSLDGRCGIDVNECASNPCDNDAVCTDSTNNDDDADASNDVSLHAYRCTCAAGFANGVCDYGYLTEFTQQCTVLESDDNPDDSNLGGNCDLDVNECASNPCQNGAACTHSEHGLSHHAYRCACTPGYTNGMCDYGYISEYTRLCTIAESSTFTGGPPAPLETDMVGYYAGNCDIDVNECESNPCQNGAVCSDSSTTDGFEFGSGDGFSGILDYSSELALYDRIAEPVPDTGTETVVGDSGNPIALGFDFAFYGNVYDQCIVSSSGYVMLSSSSVAGSVPVVDISDGIIEGMIVPCWQSPEAQQADITVSSTEGAIVISFQSSDAAVWQLRLATDGSFSIAVGSCTGAATTVIGFGSSEAGTLCSGECDRTTVAWQITPQLPVHSYSCSCTAGFAHGVCAYDFIAEYTGDCTVAINGNCDADVDECTSSPCQNGATCSDSSTNILVSYHAYQCSCVAGFANGVCADGFIGQFTDECTVQESSASGGLITPHLEPDTPRLAGNCDLDIDECDSSPCHNEAACSDSTSDPSLSNDAYRCSCAAGYANGWCEYGGDTRSPDNSSFVLEYATECTVSESSANDSFTGNCDIDVDECISNPCVNDGRCYEHVNEWECDCVEIINERTGEREAYDGEFCENPIDVCAYEEDDCDPFYATCIDLGPGHHNCSCHVGWYGDGHTCSDINECDSSPCVNGGICSESECDPSNYTQGGTECMASINPDVRPPVDQYRCNCVAGFANGVCAEEWDLDGEGIISQDLVDLYEHDCTLDLGGRCDIDINECISNPCINGAGCTDSRDTTWTDEPIEPNDFSCACTEGYANGVCTYTSIAEFVDECSVASGGICDLDVDECASNPCQNGAACSDSTSENPPVLPPPGMSPGNPAQSCEDIQADGFYTASGAFYVTVGLDTERVWCDLERDGGGWTLLLKAAADSNTFGYESTHWSTSSVLNVDDVSTSPTDAKYAAFNRLLATEYLAVWPENFDDFTWRIGPFDPRTALSFFNRDEALVLASDMGGRGDAAVPQEFNQAHFSYASGGNFQYGINLEDGVHTSVRWGFSWSSPDDATANEAGSGIGVFGQSEATRISAGTWGTNLPSATGATEARYSVQLFGRYEEPTSNPTPWTEFCCRCIFRV